MAVRLQCPVGAGGGLSRRTVVVVGEVQYDEPAIDAVAAALASISVGDLNLGESSVTEAVADSVQRARYWQEPDAHDILLADRRAVAALRLIADALTSSPATTWWQAPLDLDDQYCVGWLFGRKEIRADPPLLIGPTNARAQWRRQTAHEERRAAAERPADHSASYSGSWWSTPALSRLISTTPRLPDGTPAHRCPSRITSLCSPAGIPAIPGG